MHLLIFAHKYFPIFLLFFLDHAVNKLRHVIKEVLTKHNASLRDISINCLETLASEMYSVKLINKEVQRLISFDGIIGDFTAGMGFMTMCSELQDHCVKLLRVFTEVGGSFAIAAKALHKDWTEAGLELSVE